MIKVKIHQLKTAEETIKQLSSKQLPAKVAYQLAKLVVEVEKELIVVEQARVAAVQKYGETLTPAEPSTEDQQPLIQVKQENLEAFAKEMQELFDSEVELTGSPISIGDLEKVEITPIQVIALGPLVVE